MAAPMARVVNAISAGYPKKFGQLCQMRQCFFQRKYVVSFHTSNVYSKRKRKQKQRKGLQGPIINEEGKKALEEFQNPKSCLHNVLSLVSSEDGARYQYKLASVDSAVKESVLRVSWPEEFTVVGLGRKRSEAEKMAAALACSKLKELGVLDESNKPRVPGKVLCNKEEIKEKLWQENQPDWIQLTHALEMEVKQMLQDIKTQREGSSYRDTFEPIEEPSEGFESLFDCIGEANQLSDAVTGKPYQEMSQSRAQWKNQQLREWQLSLQDQSYLISEKANVRKAAMKLPTADMRKQILSLIEDNQVIVLSGETGCGKTTQVPQYLLEEWIEKGKGAHCNIIVTQPRRISAISVAERVAQERGERLGNTVGYQVRLQSKLPFNNGCMLFCTTGILLKKLESNPCLKGISHVIVDEVHERDINTDFLLILLKNLCRINPSLKVILMSASINTQLISSYFNNCPIVSVPGFMYPVKEYFLPEIFNLLGRQGGYLGSRSEDSSLSDEENYVRPLTDVNLTADVIQFIDENRPPGAILCFLPGWQDIRMMCDRLEEIWPNSENHLVLPVHSSVPLSSQQAIFERPAEGTRKIVLATNIAETSITINDVVYVVNPGNHKEDRYDVNLGVSCLDVQWISKANTRQRKGRAGRCQPGECFHLFSEHRYKDLEDYQVAEMLRIPLEQIVVQAKLHFRDMRAAELLCQAVQPPPLASVKKAVDILQDLAILNEDESLTMLGDKILGISTDPRLAKALVLSAIFRCVNPVLTIAAGMHTRAPFIDSMGNRSAILKIRKSFSEGSCSDHLAQVQLYDAWNKAMVTNQVRVFNDTNYIHQSTMYFIRGLRQQLAENLEEVGLVTSSQSCLNQNDNSNDCAFDDQLIKGVLCGAFFPNLLRMRKGRLGKSRMKLDQLVLKDMEFNRVLLSRRSVNCTEKKFPSRWLTYFSRVMSEEIFIHDTSMVHPLAVLCMTGRRVRVVRLTTKEMQAQMEKNVCPMPDIEAVKLVVSADIKTSRNGNVPVAFYTTYTTAMLLMDLIQEVNIMMKECLKVQHLDQLLPATQERHRELLIVLQKVINSQQIPFSKMTQDSKRSGSTLRDVCPPVNMNIKAW